MALRLKSLALLPMALGSKAKDFSLKATPWPCCVWLGLVDIPRLFTAECNETSIGLLSLERFDGLMHVLWQQTGLTL